MYTKLSGFTFIGFIDARIDTLKNVKPFYKYAINKAIYKNTESLFLISDYYYFFSPITLFNMIWRAIFYCLKGPRDIFLFFALLLFLSTKFTGK